MSEVKEPAEAVVVFKTPMLPYPLLLPLGIARVLLRKMQTDAKWEREAADLEWAIGSKARPRCRP